MVGMEIAHFGCTNILAWSVVIPVANTKKKKHAIRTSVQTSPDNGWLLFLLIKHVFSFTMCEMAERDATPQSLQPKL